MSGALVSKGLTLRSLDENKRSVDFVASTDAIDSYGDIVEQVWRLDRFLENPVILFGHNSRDLPIGQATRCEVTTANGRSQLECTVQLATAEANPVAENVWQSLLQGTLRAVSVGFVPNEYRWEKRDGKDVFVLSDNELHEISVVPIPANPEALAKMKAKALAAAGPDTDPKSPQGQETIMTEKEMQERVARADAEKALAEKTLADAHKDLSAAKTALAAAEGTITQLSTDRDGFKARAEKAEGRGRRLRGRRAHRRQDYPGREGHLRRAPEVEPGPLHEDGRAAS